MKDLAILIPCWMGADYLPFSLFSLRKNCGSSYDIFVILNEVDELSLSICKDQNVRFIALDSNEGTLAVDHAIPYLRDYKYVANYNIDMIACPNWDITLLEAMEKYGPKCTVSSPAVEYSGGSNGLDTLNDPSLPNFASMETIAKFSSNFKKGKYKFPNIISQRHPVVCRTEDYLAVGGYSDNYDYNYFPGYSLDFDFPYRLWSKRGISKMVSVGDAPVLHDYSSTMNKLPPDLKSRNCWSYFKIKNGLSVEEFKAKINFNSIVN